MGQERISTKHKGLRGVIYAVIITVGSSTTRRSYFSISRTIKSVLLGEIPQFR